MALVTITIDTGNNQSFESDEDYLLLQQKVGRNLILFQHLEKLIKLISSRREVTIRDSSEFEEVNNKLNNKYYTSTFGQVLSDYEKIYVSSEKEPQEPKEIEGDFLVSTKLSIETPEWYRTERLSSLKLLLEERNELVHHLLETLDRTSSASCKTISTTLDEQQLRIRTEIKSALELLDRFAFLGSTMARKEVLEEFRRITKLSEYGLFDLLSEFNLSHSDEERWSCLSSASHYVKQSAPDVWTEFKSQAQNASLKKEMKESGLFDFTSVTTSKGGTRQLYRMTHHK